MVVESVVIYGMDGYFLCLNIIRINKAFCLLVLFGKPAINKTTRRQSIKTINEDIISQTKEIFIIRPSDDEIHTYIYIKQNRCVWLGGAFKSVV